MIVKYWFSLLHQADGHQGLKVEETALRVDESTHDSSLNICQSQKGIISVKVYELMPLKVLQSFGRFRKLGGQ